LGSGVPIGACLAAGRAAGTFKPGNHGSTFGGNPLACTAGIATLDIIEQDGLLAHAEHIGQMIRDDLAAALQGVNGIRTIRGQGLMLGIELDKPCAELVGRGLDNGLLINVTADSVIRLLPPLILSRDEARQLVTGLAALIKDFLQS